MTIPTWATNLDVDTIPAPARGQRDTHGKQIADGTSFADVFARHFQSLTDWEAEHGPAPEQWAATPDTAGIYHELGLDEVDFGRERGTWTIAESDWHDPADGPWLVVSARNGGHEPDCWEGNEPDCTCNACCHRRVMDLPQLDFEESEDGDNAYFFRVPERFRDRVRLQPLVWARSQLLAGRCTPWELVLGPNPANTHDLVKNRQKRSDLNRQLADMDAREALLVEFADILAEPCPPVPQVERRSPVTGRKLRGTEPAHIPTMGPEGAQWFRKKLAKDADKRRKRAELTAALDLDLPAEARHLIEQALGDEGIITWDYRLDDAYTRERIGLHRLADAARRYPAERERIALQLAELDEAGNRPGDFRYWPGDWASHQNRTRKG